MQEKVKNNPNQDSRFQKYQDKNVMPQFVCTVLLNFIDNDDPEVSLPI